MTAWLRCSHHEYMVGERFGGNETKWSRGGSLISSTRDHVINPNALRDSSSGTPYAGISKYGMGIEAASGQSHGQSYEQYSMMHV